MPSRADSPDPGSVETRIVEVGAHLARTFNSVLDALPGVPHRPQWLARSLGVNTVLTSRLLKAAGHPDPIAVAHLIPGPEPLRRLLRAAEKKRVEPALIREARTAVDRFERLIDTVAGDRSALDAIISGWLPAAREQVELLAKQSVFRGVGQLLGTTSDLEHRTIILYPSAETRGRADSLWITVTRGLRRVRPGLVVKYDSIHTTTPVLTIGGQPVDGLRGLLLERFCSKPLPKLKVSHLGGRAQYTLSGDAVGVQSAVDLVYAMFLPGKKELNRASGEGPRKSSMAVGIARPSKLIIVDVLLHRDVYPGQEPELRLYRGTAGEGPADPDDASQDINRLDIVESIKPLGQGLASFVAQDAPGHQDMIRHVCKRRGWDVEKLRGYRCRIEYPMYSSQIVISFELPVGDR
jgi:hypothetical protein